jgi:hypothetical protein
MIAVKQKGPYDGRYYGRVFPSMAIYAVLSTLGYFIIVAVLPENMACALDNVRWFVALWPANFANEKILVSLNGTLDSCRVIPATAWSASIGILMLFDRIVYEIRYNERRRFVGMMLPFMYFCGALLLFAPESLNPTIIGDSNSFYSVSFKHPDLVTNFQLLVFSFGTFFLLSECVAFTLIYIRSKIDDWTRKGPTH